MPKLLTKTFLCLVLAGGLPIPAVGDDGYPAAVPIVLGVFHQPVPSVVTEELGLDANHGAIITDVHPESAGGRMGLQRGDIIVSLNDIPVLGGAATHAGGVHDNGDTLRMIIRNQIQGDAAELEVIRDGSRVRLRDAFSQRPADFNSRDRDESTPSWVDQAIERRAAQRRELNRIQAEIDRLAERLRREPVTNGSWIIRYVISP